MCRVNCPNLELRKIMQLKFKGNKEGFCNICGQHSQLTRNPIRLQGCIKPTPVELSHLSQYLCEPNKKSTISQSRLILLSICGNCNNNLLGTEYDPELIEVSKQVSRLVRFQGNLGLLNLSIYLLIEYSAINLPNILEWCDRLN